MASVISLEKRIEKKGLFSSVNELKSALDLSTEDTSLRRKRYSKGNRKLLGQLTVKQVMQSKWNITAIDVENRPSMNCRIPNQ